MISGRAEIREAYRNEAVARQYVEARFREPLGAMLHARQVAALTRIIRAQRPRRVLEIAPGPGRLTVDVAPAVEGQTVLVEASAEMLGEARRRLAGVVRRPDLLQGDAFHLPFGRAFDLVYSFRLIRHFVASERAGLYREIARVLRPGEYEHFDALTRPDVLAAELQHAGLELLSLEGVQRNYPALSRIQTLIAPRSRPVARIAIEITDRLGGAPLEWIVTCRRR